MRNMFPILGRNKNEFPLSITIVVLGFIGVFIVLPLHAYESHTSHSTIENDGAKRIMIWLICALTGLFCSLNAYRDEELSATARQRILAWSILLCIWAGALLYHLMIWWQNLHPSVKPSWLGGS